MIEGIVIKSTGSWYRVKAVDTGRVFQCRIIGKFRLEGKKLTNPVAVGDRVKLVIENEGESSALIKEILPRENYVVRQSPRKKFFLHLIAANVDQAIVLSTIREPNLKQGFIDRFLLMTEPYNIPTIIVFNKADVLEEEDLEIYAALEFMYEEIGYDVRLISALDGDGLEELRELLKDKTTLISGHSGVGKSTLVNHLQPGLEIDTQEISNFSGKGQHTTTFAEMHELDFGGRIIDTPGIKSLSFINMEPQEVAHNFREFFEYSKDCRFSNCQHINEPSCAVKEAIEAGEISELRYMNYLQILDDINDQNHWDRVK